MTASSSKRIKVISIPVGSDPMVVEIPPTLEAMQALVGGVDGGCDLIQVVPLHDGLELVCDEEDKLKGLPLHLRLFGGQDFVAGDCFLVRHDDEGEAASVTPADVARYVGRGRVASL
jgi:hypothetical protein